MRNYESSILYVDRNGNKYRVRNGLDDEVKTFRQRADHDGSTGWHAVSSPKLPWRKDPAEAEKDLENYAAKHGMTKEEQQC